MTEIQAHFTVVGAKDLPKTDRFSSIDAYVEIKVPAQSTQKTSVIDNNRNPTWNSSHSLFLPYDFNSATPLPKIEFALWDHNSVSKDEKVCTGELQVQPNHFQNGGWEIQVPLKQENEKHSSHNSVLLVRFGEYAYSANSLHKLLQPLIPNIQFSNDGLGRLYIPLTIPNTVLVLEYEAKCVDVKLLVTSPANTHYFDMIRVNHANSLVRRRNVKNPFTVHGYQVYEEIKMNDIPFSVIGKPGRVLFFAFQKTLVSEEDLGKTVVRHGWAGSMGWVTASATLKEVELDRKEQEIFMKKDDSFIVVDFDQGNVDMKCLVLDVPQNSEVAYDFLLKGEDVKKTSEIYSPPKKILDGKYSVQRKLELDDVPYGTPFANMIWYKYRVTSPMQVDIFDVVKLQPF